MRTRSLLRLTKSLAPLLTLISLSSCASPVNDPCGWVKPILLDKGYETRLTDFEAREIDKYDQDVVKNCN